MEFYNTMKKAVEKFVPLKKEVTAYCCGPTVYNFVHIGNLRTDLFYDILRRTLIYNGFKVKQIINITDVDDKTIKNSGESGIKLKEYTEQYTQYFFEDLEKLNIEKAEEYPRATEHIQEMQNMILKLIAAGYGYKTADGIYYSISKFKDYGKLSGVKAGASAFRISDDEYDKDSPSDFALWKNWTEGDGDVYWEGDLPKGRPGWHIECSAMSLKYLGETIDIHSGGVDLIFPHHENEIAQSEGANGKQFVRYWLHPEHLLVNGEKMAKSAHNFYTLRDLEKLGFDPISLRLFFIDSHYRTRIDFTIDAIKKCERTLDDIEISLGAFSKVEKTSKNENVEFLDKILNEFSVAINSDFNTHLALEKFFEVLTNINREVSKGSVSSAFYMKASEIIKRMDSILGILRYYEAPQKIVELAELRKTDREKAAWADADAKRKLIKQAGFKIIDLPNLQYVIIKDRKYGK